MVTVEGEDRNAVANFRAKPLKSAGRVQIINASTESIVRKVSTNSDGDFVATLLPP